MGKTAKSQGKRSDYIERERSGDNNMLYHSMCAGRDWLVNNGIFGNSLKNSRSIMFVPILVPKCMVTCSSR